MRKVFIVVSAFVLLSLASFTTSAAGTQHYGPFMSTSTDSGTCGNDWANDTFERHFTVSKDGTQVTEDFKNGSFVTLAGASPGSCLPGNTPHVNVAGGQGKMHGSFDIVVSNGQFNPNAVCTQSTCGTTADFIKTVFGAAATYDVPTFEFHYSQGAGTSGEWKNASADRGGNHGDITTP